MKLYILRHGLAVDRESPGYPDDRLRPLTPAGRRKIRRAARGMKALGLKFDLILSSPYVRARATARIAADALGCGSKLKLSDHLTPDGSAAALLRFLGRGHTKKRVLLVGHEPYLSGLIARLISGSSSARLKLKKGALARLDVEHLKLGRCADLEFLLTAGQLGGLSR